MRTIHFRNYDDYVKYGRYTAWTVVYFKKLDKIYIGFSRCSKSDNFNKRIGRSIACLRAVACSTNDRNEKYCFDVKLSPIQSKMNDQELETKIYDEIARVFFNKIIKKHHNKKDLRIINTNKIKIRLPKMGFWYTSKYKSEIVSE